MHAIIHGSFHKQFDPRKLKHWTLAVLCKDESVLFPKCYVRCTLSTAALSELQQTYSSLYMDIVLSDDSLNGVCKRYSFITYNQVCYKAKSIVYANKCSQATFNMHSKPTGHNPTEPQLAIIHHFIVHSFYCEGDVYMHLFAVVSWLKEHPARRGYCSKSFELWWKDLFDSNLVEYLPVQLIICHAVYCDIKYEEQTVFLICPVQNIPPLD